MAISIHALREEGDRSADYVSDRIWNFYPRPPRGGRPITSARKKARDIISIHALREEGDAKLRNTSTQEVYFYPRPPRGGRQYAASQCFL